jgi:hypothetical protein
MAVLYHILHETVRYPVYLQLFLLNHSRNLKPSEALKAQILEHLYKFQSHPKT